MSEVPTCTARTSARGQDAAGHRAELREREVADAGEQLLSADVAGLAAVGLEHGALGVVERLAHEMVGLAREARVLGQDGLEGGVEILRHVSERFRRTGPRAAGAAVPADAPPATPCPGAR